MTVPFNFAKRKFKNSLLHFRKCWFGNFVVQNISLIAPDIVLFGQLVALKKAN